MTTGIYQIACLPTGKTYIGQSINIAHRFEQHKSDLRLGRHGNRYLQAAWLKYGEEAFTLSILEETEVELLTEREIHWILHLKSHLPATGFNLTLPTIGQYFQHTDDVKRRISESKRGKLNPRFGKPAYNRGIAASEETKRKQSLARIGRKRSKEARQNYGKTYVLTNGDETVTFKNLSLFCEERQLNRGCLNHVINGRNKQHKGWRLPLF